MENVLADNYDHPKEIEALMTAVCEYHLVSIRAYGEMGCEGTSISDELVRLGEV